MSDTKKPEFLSRRKALTLLGLATFGLTTVPVLLTTEDAAAQQTGAPPTSSQTGAAPATGTERRQTRRKGRTERRQTRRKGRTERRTTRRTGTTSTTPAKQ